MKTYEEALAELEKQLAESEMPDVSLVGFNDTRFSLRQIVQEVKDKTPYGMRFINKWIAMDDIKNPAKKKVGVVLMNADWTEGRGPMLFHKVFESVEKAEDYVKKQEGIMGSKQYDSPRVYGNTLSYNGYDIKEVEMG